MGKERVYNFSAGPSMLPLEVLERAGSEITNYEGSGMSPRPSSAACSTSRTGIISSSSRAARPPSSPPRP